MAADQVAVSRKKIAGEAPIVVAELTDDCIYTGLFGSLDSSRMALVTDKLTALAEKTGAAIAVIDLANVDTINSSISTELIRLGDTLALLGVKPIYCGLKSMLARTMVTAEVNLSQHTISRNLKSALKMSFRMSGYQLIKITDDEFETVLATDS